MDANWRVFGVPRSLWLYKQSGPFWLYKPVMLVSESMKSTVTPSIWGQAVLLVALKTLKCRTSCCVPAICWSSILVPGRDLSVAMCGGRSVSSQLQMFVQPGLQLHWVDAKATACVSESERASDSAG